jgi:hypothetical protein
VIKHRAGALLATAAVAVIAAGCGSSSKSSSASSTTAASASSTASAGGSQPVSKTDYEQQLGPLLNNKVAPALRTALANGGIANPQRLGAAIAEVKLAHDRMAAVNPPAAIADLHQQAVTDLAAIQADMEKLRVAELNKARTNGLAALKALRADATKIVNIGNAFSARGF